MGRRGLACALIALGLSSVTGVGAAAAAYPGAPGPVVFALVGGSGREGEEEEFGGLRAHGPGRDGGTTTLTTAAHDNDPAVSADGRQIAFTRRPEVEPESDHPEATHIYVMDAEGGEAHQLTFGPYADADPTFSPDGGEIVFDRFNRIRQDDEILAVSSAGGTPRVIAGGLDRGALAQRPEPVFTPNGAWIFFVDQQKRGTPRQNAGIFAMRPDGGGRHAVITGPYEDVSPDTSPDGQGIVFISNRPTTPRGQLTDNVFTADLDGGGVRQLTRNRRRGLDLADPSWSPDGRHIVLRNGAVGEEQLLLLKVGSPDTVYFDRPPADDLIGPPCWGVRP